MFFSPDEPGNNLNYHLSGEAVSPLLRAIPLDLRVMIALALFGLFAAQRQRERAAILLAAAFVTLMLGIMVIWVEGRLRTPVIVFVAPLAAYGIVYAVERFPFRLSGGSLAVSVPDARQFAVFITLTALILIITGYFYHDLPHPQTAAKLPASAQRVDAIYDKTLKLVGWQVQEDYSRAGIISPFKPYVVSFYWQLLQPTTVDYNFSLHWYIDEKLVVGVDHPIGRVNYPHITTSQWDTGKIYVEHVPLGYKGFTGPTDKSGLLMVSVYSDPNAFYMLPAEGIPSSPWRLQIAQPALIWGEGKFPDTLTHLAEPIRLGGKLEIRGVHYPCSVAAGDSIDVTIGWRTTQQPIDQSYIIGVYVMNDAGDTLYTQIDSPPHDGQLLTSSLPTQHRFGDTKRLPVPNDPGHYAVFVAVYDVQTFDRLQVPGTAHNLARLGILDIVDSQTPADEPESGACYGG